MKTKKIELRDDISLAKQTNQISDWVFLLFFVAAVTGFVLAVVGFIYLMTFLVSFLY